MTLERRNVLYGFSGLSALLALALVYQIAAPLPDIAPPQLPAKPRVQQAAAVAPVSTPPPEVFAEIATRPLFSPSRRGAVAPTTGTASLAPPEVALVGIMIDSHDRIAMLRVPGSPLANAFHLGATVSGWQLSEIAPDRVVLTAGGARDEIRLDANKPPAKPAAPPPGNSQ